MMDGRDFGPARSVHVPPPLLSGLAMESHRLGAAAAAGRIPPSPGHLGAGHPAALHTGKFLSPAMNMHSHHSDSFPGASSPFLSGYSSSAHGGPSPLSSDPAFRAPNPASLQMAQLWASHPHEGFPHLPSSLYPSPYIPLGHLEHPQFSQHALFDSQKEGFYLPGSVHSQSAMARSPVAHMPGSLSREKEALPSHKSSKDSSRELGKEKPCKSDLGHSLQRKERERPKEESRPHSVVDLTQDIKAEDERRAGNTERPAKTTEHTRPFFHQHSPALSTTDTKPKQPHQNLLGNCGTSSSMPDRHPSTEQERRDRERDEENSRTGGQVFTDKQKRCDSVATSVGTLHVSYGSPSSLQSNQSHLPPRLVSSGTYPPPHHMPPSMYPLYSTTKEPGKEHRVIAPTYVPSVEVYDERKGPIQIASQARDNKNDKSRERDSHRSSLLLGNERTHMDHSRSSVRSESPPHGDVKRDVLREEGSVIRSNGLAMKKPLYLEGSTNKSGNSPDARDLTNTTSKHMIQSRLEAESRSQERDRLQRSAHPFSGMDPGALHSEQRPMRGLVSAEPKWKPFEMGNYATSHIAALAAQHTHGTRGEEEGKRMYLDTTGLHRPVGSGGSPEGHGEVSAMQSLIKYSGNFSSESGSRHGSDSRSPFGGLGSMKLEASYPGVSRIQHLLPQQPGKQLKKEPERPESAKSFGRDGSSSQGEAEVRHPPVGIAVAVARQRDNSSKLSSVSDRDRPLLGGTIKGPIHVDEEQGDERVRHRSERLLSGRVEREQEKVLRESKELADYTQLHPPMVSASGLNPNLMVTGGPTLAGAGRWPADPASHLASHPWLPRPGAPSMWLSGSPYGLGPPSLHQALPPGYSPALTGSIPPPYQFARDPQTGQLVVVPTEHLPHYADMLERGPPLWSAMYPSAGSSLQHAHQLQLLSHQQLLRQQELYMIQHQTAQVMELQRNAQLVERLNASHPRADLEDKPDKRGTEGTKASLSGIPAPSLHSRKPPLRSPTPSTSYSKVLTPLPVTPLPSPVTALKSEERRKVEKSLSQQTYSHQLSPAPHPVSSASASPHPTSPIRPKEETVEVPEKESLSLQKQASSPFPSMYPEIPPGYPYQSITAPFGSHYPYLLQPAAAADADGLAPDVPLPAETSKHLESAADVKPRHLCSPVVVEPLQASRDPESMEESSPQLKKEPSLEENKDTLTQDVLRPLHSVSGAASITPQDSSTTIEAEAHPRSTATPENEENQDGKEAIKVEVSSSSHPGLYNTSRTDSERITTAEAAESSVGLEDQAYKPSSSHTDVSCDVQLEYPPLDLSDRLKPVELQEPAPDALDLVFKHDDLFLPYNSPPHLQPSSAPVPILPEDPMAGMIALVTASELPQAGAVSILTEACSSRSELCLGVSSLESTALEGMALLSQIAELEIQRQPRDNTQGVMLCGLESLLEAGRQVLLEAIECQPEVIICLPRELNPNKKYSWRQKKDEPMFSRSSLKGMDAVEVDYRVKLTKLQQRYKEKQRELGKLQRRRDKEEKRQQHQQLQQERNRSLARRGPGRPRKRKHGLCALSPPSGKLDSKCAKLGRSVLYSEDSESGEVLRKRFRPFSRNGEEEEDSSALRLKKKKKSWSEQEASSSYSHELTKMGMKKSRVSEQEQLASKLDKALSLTKLVKLGKPSCKFADGSSGKSRVSSGSRIPSLTDIDLRVKTGKSSLSKNFDIFHKSSKGGKSKIATKTKSSDPCLKGKCQRKVPYSPLRSEISSYSNITDSEDDESLKDGWPPSSMLGRTVPRPQLPSLCSTPSKKNCSSSKRASSSSSSSSLKSKQAAKERKHKHFALLLQEAGVSSSEDSFDQEYLTERDDYEDDDDNDDDYELDESDGLCSSIEESGLGLLARFAASAIPSPIVPNPLSIVQLEAKQKAKKKEERQSLLGTEFKFTDSESDVKARKKFPSLLHGKRSAPELPLLPPASVMREEFSPSKRGCKPKKPKSLREFTFDLTADGSEDEQWTRRRSERIFLHDAAQANPISPSNKTPLPFTPKPARGPKPSQQSPKELAKAKEGKDPNKKRIKETPLCLPPTQLSSIPTENAGALPVCPGHKSKVKPKAREARGKGGAVSKLMESMAADEDFEPNQDSSFSEDENPPVNAQPERPCTPAPRNCVINKDELQDGLRVLIPMDDKLLYAGHVSTVHSPDIYSVVVEGERGNRPHIYCLEQLLQEAIIDVKPPSVRYLPQGTRIAAYWSQQYRCLYPGTVVRGSPDMEEADDLITVEFDDGDTGRIPISHIRLLPPDYKIQCAEPSPALLVASTRRRGRKCSKDVHEGKETPPKSTEESVPKSRGRGRKPKPKPEPEVTPKEHEKTDTPAPTQVPERPLSSQKSVPQPGRKIKQAGPSISVSNESQKKTTGIKPPAKVRSQPQSVYSPPLYGKVLSVDLYNEPSTSLASFMSNNGTASPAGKGKPVKRLRKAEEETSAFGVKMQRKQPQTEILIKLDHEGVMSPKTKKTKALMMMEGQNLSKHENKSVMGVSYMTVSTTTEKTFKAKTKPVEAEPPNAESVSTYSVRKLGCGSDGLMNVSNSGDKEKREQECPNCSSSSSSSSESDGEEQGASQDKKPKQDSTSSNSSRASSPTSSSTSTSSSSSSAGSHSSSSSSSSSSTTSDEESSCSSDEEHVTVSQPSPVEQVPPQEEEEKTKAKAGLSANIHKIQKQHSSTTQQEQCPQQQKPQKQQKVKQGVGRPKRREGIHLPTTKELAKRQRLPSVENRPKISAFLPARQLWKWFGKPTQRRGMKGKAKKLFYKAIMRGKEMICIGDCAVFLSAGRPNLPFIGHIQSMWESWGSNMVVRVKWFYHPEETNPGKKLHDKKNWDQMSGQSLPAVLQASNQRKDFMERALYQSSHIDENDVQTISHKCLVVSLEQYEQMIKTKKYQDSEDLYYLAGTYEPTTGMIFNTDGVPVIC
ncbi:trinucleotide repeat-containing gene 18 protein-like isoform X2 [Myxocyprinus asiaticus]|uniref:trinucleotide repeat-containing gene 18 protein-like isoform X2 n=1 Tax=Myxocyprinus asiaticus TaxID=70543 RepID=UPI0022237288|nr:trinucleotide repeat-containing gene 18 protein-like isoform X2 [Myxocyprinus asiaticus]